MSPKDPITLAKDNFKNQLNKGVIMSFKQLQVTYDDEFKSRYNEVLKVWYDCIVSLSFLPRNLDDLEEILIHGPTKIVLKSQKTKELETDLTQDDINIMADILAIRAKQNFNYETPFVSFYDTLFDTNVRISLTHFSSSADSKSKIFIRILNKNIIPLNHYNINEGLIKKLITQRKNILIAGATSSGKTTFANTLLSLTSKREHIIMIEDTKELIAPSSYTTRLISDPNNHNKSMNSYLSYCLRMSPERIILGEIRGKEAESSLLAMNTGHNGFISTIHANSAKDALERLALLFKIYSTKDLSFATVLKLIASNINYVIFLKDKQITEIIDIFGSENENLFYENIALCEESIPLSG